LLVAAVASTWLAGSISGLIRANALEKTMSTEPSSSARAWIAAESRTSRTRPSTTALPAGSPAETSAVASATRSR
jgi:hypothetical protein